MKLGAVSCVLSLVVAASMNEEPPIHINRGRSVLLPMLLRAVGLSTMILRRESVLCLSKRRNNENKRQSFLRTRVGIDDEEPAGQGLRGRTLIGRQQQQQQQQQHEQKEGSPIDPEDEPGDEDSVQSSSSSEEDIPAWAAEDATGKINVEGLGHDHQVCLSWLNGVCTRGSTCPYIHRFDLKKMPDCVREATYGECREEGCPFRHKRKVKSSTKEDAEEKDDDEGADAEVEQRQRKTHTPAPCPYFFFGMCPYGDACKLEHIHLPGPPPPPWKVVKWFVEGKLPKRWHKYVEPISNLPLEDDKTVVDWFLDHGGVNPNGTEFDQLHV
mmetsp:Transcript_10025/g.19236  ORF Transcript_10025/g.19236 Transcript_10025/m.19236 type:complete len:327 (-) Transcript_10025:152-1132(-)